MTFKESKEFIKAENREERKRRILSRKVLWRVCNKVRCVGCPIYRDYCGGRMLRVNGDTQVKFEGLKIAWEWATEKA